MLLALLGLGAVAVAGPDLALVVSGGVSLGSYEAGYLYYLDEATRRAPGSPRLRFATGTSAGSVNALLAAMSSCGPPTHNPADSVLYRTWLGVGFDDLYVPAEVTAQGALTRSGFREAVGLLREEWAKGLPESCDVVLGFTTTRVTPARSAVGAFPAVSRSEERFVVRLRGHGEGEPPTLTPVILPNQALPQPVLPESKDPLGSLMQVLLASAAFPIAFSPMPVPFCTVEGPDAVASCEGREVTTTELIDGALFENTPLHLAVDLARAEGAEPLYAVLPASTMPWPRPAAQEPEARDPDSTIALLLAITSGFVETAQELELRSVIAEHPDVVERMTLNTGALPSHGELLYGFGGFFERTFREADFVQGMAAAHLSLRRRGAQLTSSESEPGWRPFRCVVGLLDGQHPDVCRHPEVAPLRPLFQVAIDRVYAECAQVGADELAMGDVPHGLCRDAINGGKPPIVPGLRIPEDQVWQRLDDEDWLAHQLRRLYAHGFAWNDEGIGVARPIKARRHLRDRLAQVAVDMAQANRSGGSLMVRLAAEVGLDAVAYRAPRAYSYVGLGAPRLEVGYSRRLGRGAAEWMRVGVALAIDGFDRRLDEPGTSVAITPSLDLQFESMALSTGVLQPRIGVQIGYRFGSDDTFGSGLCVGRRQRCSQPVFHVYAGGSVVQRLRFQLGLGLYPPIRTGQQFDVWLLPLLGVQFPTRHQLPRRYRRTGRE